MKEETITLAYKYVAFLDLLGFTAMVKSDCNGPNDKIRYLPKLLKIHKSITHHAKPLSDSLLTQFSDSIVLAFPFGQQPFSDAACLIAKYQYSLLQEGILCRGGISFGKHYQDGTFLFSEGLLKAYKIESEQAKYPRIIVDKDIIELRSDKEPNIYEYLIEEADGAIFLDYFKFGTPERIQIIIQQLSEDAKNFSGSEKEKHRWLREYFSTRFPHNLDLKCTRFNIMEKAETK